LDRRLCHVDRPWSLILNSEYILIVQSTIAWALLPVVSSNRETKYIYADVKELLKSWGRFM
jgi:hypothetical protein